jgi:hypothetical protein
VTGQSWLTVKRALTTQSSGHLVLDPNGEAPAFSWFDAQPEVTELGEIPDRDLPQPQVICDMTGLSGHCIRSMRGAARSSGSIPVSYGS